MSEKLVLPKMAEQYLAKCYAIAQWGGTLLLFISLLPYMALRNNPGKLEPGMELLKSHVSSVFSPLFFTLVAMSIAIFFAAVQTKFIAAYVIEQGKDVSVRQFRLLSVPFRRYWEVMRIFGEVPGVKASVICAALFWISYPVLGLLNPFSPYFLLASVLLFFYAAKKCTGKSPRLLYRIFIAMLLTAYVCLNIGAFSSIIKGRDYVNEQKERVSKNGIPLDREGLKKLIYNGNVPDKEYTRLLDDTADSRRKFFEEQLFDAEYYYVLPESFRKENRNARFHSETAEFFKPVVQAMDQGTHLQYDYSLDEKYLWHPGKLPLFSRSVVQYFTSGIFAALEKKDIRTAMKNFRRLTVYQEICMNGDYLMGLAFICLAERSRACAVGAMIGSGLLTDGDLGFIRACNSNREQALRKALLNTLRREAAFEQEVIRDMSDPYVCLRSALASPKGLWSNLFVRFLLRGNLYFPPNLWNAVLERNVRCASLEKYNVLIDHFSGDKDLYQWEKDDLPVFEALMKSNSSYYTVLNYRGLREIFTGVFQAVTMVRMTDAAVSAELYRRKYGRFPQNLSGVDAVSGKGFTLRQDGWDEVVWTSKGRNGKHSLKGWRVCSSDDRFSGFKVPVWPVPAAPEIGQGESGK